MKPHNVFGTVSVDQTAAPASETVGGISWSSLGNFTTMSGATEIDLSDNANGTVVAGGIRIVAVHVTEPPVFEPVTDQTTTAEDDASIRLGATDPDAPAAI
ncbi:MAG TPA: hypothetical protein VHX65_00770 [Pirellulales bacterium]|jgi:hypothetical protein|nr:hypothetical protein [Pirellulales bacterium]